MMTVTNNPCVCIGRDQLESSLLEIHLSVEGDGSKVLYSRCRRLELEVTTSNNYGYLIWAIKGLVIGVGSPVPRVVSKA